jgi:DNA end-binding protein Ku
MRPYWKGYLKLALVSCPIALHPACSSTERIGFRQINKATGNRLRQQLIDEESREPVAPEHKGRGYEVAKGQYLIVEDAELEAIEIESTHVIEIDRFVPRQQIDQRFFDAPYYVAPNEPVAQEAFAVVREAMRHKTMVALGRVVLSKRERVIALEPYGKGLLGTTLRYLSLLKIQFGAIEGRDKQRAASPILCGSTLIAMMQAPDLREGNYVIACAG